MHKAAFLPAGCVKALRMCQEPDSSREGKGRLGLWHRKPHSYISLLISELMGKLARVVQARLRASARSVGMTSVFLFCCVGIR